jgi:hypothetical protein
MLAERTFSAIHGLPGLATAAELAGSDPARVNLFIVLEYVRALAAARRRWPGSRRLIDWGLATELAARPPGCRGEALLGDAASERPASRAAVQIVEAAERAEDPFQAAEAMDREPLAGLIPSLSGGLIRAFSFLPDLMYPARASQPSADRLVADMKSRASRRRRRTDTRRPEAGARDGSAGGSEGTLEDTAASAGYLYHEWDQTEHEFREDWCAVEPKTPDSAGQARLPERFAEHASRVRRLFERLKPEVTRTERRLESGDEIDIERLVWYRVARRVEPSPRVDFYESPVVARRDLAVLLLLDVSGSTGTDIGDGQVLDVEKYAALILGQGLAVLGDRFAVTGFSSNGRESCEYFIYKEFGEGWTDAVKRRIASARPRNSTRMGAALRHSGWMLSGINARTRLILLMTDGKPEDRGYDPNTRYAQHDVRIACEENERASIATFAISTEENSLADLQIMFPRRRFVVLTDIRRLPTILPQLYVRMTL